MLIISRYEDLNRNTIVIWADVLLILKQKQFNLENLYQEIKHKGISLDEYYDIITFLWLTEAIVLDTHLLTYKSTWF